MDVTIKLTKQFADHWPLSGDVCTTTNDDNCPLPCAPILQALNIYSQSSIATALVSSMSAAALHKATCDEEHQNHDGSDLVVKSLILCLNELGSLLAPLLTQACSSINTNDNMT